MAGLNFGDLLEAVACAVPDETAIVFGDRTDTWRRFDERTNRLARALLARGVEPGAKVAFYLRNSPAYLELLFACFKARLVHVNVNYRYVEAELGYLLENSDSEIVVYDAEFADEVERLRPELRTVRAWIMHRRGNDEDEHDDEFDALCRSGDSSPLGNERSGDDLYFMYTGGTTGRPKGVMWPHAARIEAMSMVSAASPAEHAAAVAAATRRPVVLPACPMMHSTGFTTSLTALLAGGTVVVMPEIRFDAAATLDTIERRRVTSVALVGDAFSVPILEVLRSQPGRRDLSSVTTLTSAGAMWSADRKRELLEHFRSASLFDSLGSSEGSRLASSLSRAGDTVQTARFTIGPTAKVFDEQLREIEPGSGVPGRLATRGGIPLGYYRDPEATAETFPVIGGERWSIPGDWCLLEADGTIQLLGRGSHCINTGGEKVWPEEVEETLKLHPAVVDAAVFGVPDPRWGQAVAAVVGVSRPVDRDELQVHLDTALARHKHPKQLTVTHLGFRGPNGKLDYAAAREILGADGR